MVSGDVLGKGLDDDGQLGLVVDLIAPRWQDDRSIRADDGGIGLEEDDRLARGPALPHLGDVVRVVLPDPHDLGARDDRGQEPGLAQLDDLSGGLGQGVEGVPLENQEVPLGLARGDLAVGQPLDDAVAGLVTGGESCDLHGCQPNAVWVSCPMPPPVRRDAP